MARKEKVTKVIDGDTFETDRRKNPVRLSGVDTPEKGHKGFSEAKKALEKMIGGEEVSIESKARDSYGRSVANVKRGRNSINKAMNKYDK